MKVIENPMVVDSIWRTREEAAERVAVEEIKELRLTQLNDIENELADIRTRLQEIGQEFKNDLAITVACSLIEDVEGCIGRYVKYIEQGLIQLDY